MNLINNEYMLFSVIIDFGKGTKILNAAKKLGATGGTFLLGKGTVRSSLLSILGLDEVRKEILLMCVESNLDETLHKELTEKFSLNKPNHGIAFSIPIKSIIGTGKLRNIIKEEEKGVDNMGYEAIFTIVNRGLSDDVIEAAQSAGSTGGTIIHGRGSGTHETEKLFNIEIEPEKDIVLILSEKSKTKEIVDAINNKLGIEGPGKGILFVLDVNRTSGLFKK